MAEERWAVPGASVSSWASDLSSLPGEDTMDPLMGMGA